MTNRLGLAILLPLLALFGLLAGCGLSDSTPTYRYRLTVEVETPEGLRTGSSVIEVDTAVASKYSIPTPGQVTTRVRGEAVAVDLPDGRTLFALLRSEESVDWAGAVMFNLAPEGRDESGDRFLGTFAKMPEMKGVITLPRYWPKKRGDAHRAPPRPAYPMLVTFGDLSDPASVERVAPDDLAASLGTGVHLKRITVQMTDDPVTADIATRLPWADAYRHRHFDGTLTVSEDLATNDLSGHLSSGSFSTQLTR